MRKDAKRLLAQKAKSSSSRRPDDTDDTSDDEERGSAAAAANSAKQEAAALAAAAARERQLAENVQRLQKIMDLQLSQLESTRRTREVCERVPHAGVPLPHVFRVAHCVCACLRHTGHRCVRAPLLAIVWVGACVIVLPAGWCACLPAARAGAHRAGARRGAGSGPAAGASLAATQRGAAVGGGGREGSRGWWWCRAWARGGHDGAGAAGELRPAAERRC
jgi:hypothetical protein